MDSKDLLVKIEDFQDILRLSPQIVGRFYADGNRLGQRRSMNKRPMYYKPERWIGSSTAANNPSNIPPAGLSMCSGMGDHGRGITLRELLLDPECGPRLLGPERYTAHKGMFRVLVKLLDAGHPIPFHVHAADAFVAAHPDVYPTEQFGKEEAYHYLDLPKGICPYLHLGVHPGVGPKEILAALRRGTDHVLELSPYACQRLGEGFIVRSGLLHRPGTAVTLEIQQPSDVYAFFQLDFAGQPLPESVLSPGFASIDQAAEQIIDWDLNRKTDLLTAAALRPEPVAMLTGRGCHAEWIFPPDASDKFSGMRLTIETSMTFKVGQPCILFIWKGTGKIADRTIDGDRGRLRHHDEFFVGAVAAQRGFEIRNKGEEPLVAYALFAAALD